MKDLTSLKTVEEVKKEMKDKLIQDAKYDVDYHEKKLAESKLKLEAAKSFQ